MNIKTSRFGEVAIDDDAVISMPEGMLGFSEITRYVLIQHRDGSPFLWYQAVDEPNLAFVVVDAFTFFPDYEIVMSTDDVEVLDCKKPGDLAVFLVVVIPDNPEEMTANLRGPLVINVSNKVARQVVLTDDKYSPHHSIMEEMRKRLPAEELPSTK
ncbi:MAG: flagellar assembly protein FliW [bacterium]|jgi:flagellar assembly factor FliW